MASGLLATQNTPGLMTWNEEKTPTLQSKRMTRLLVADEAARAVWLTAESVSGNKVSDNGHVCKGACVSPPAHGRNRCSEHSRQAFWGQLGTRLQATSGL